MQAWPRQSILRYGGREHTEPFIRSQGRPLPAIDIVLAARDKRRHGGAVRSAHLLLHRRHLSQGAAALVDLLLAVA